MHTFFTFNKYVIIIGTEIKYRYFITAYLTNTLFYQKTTLPLCLENGGRFEQCCGPYKWAYDVFICNRKNALRV